MSVSMRTEEGESLPVPRTSMVGREQEASEIADLLLKPYVSLVTVTGPGGAGKTRLALKVAAELADHFRDGVCFVPCGPVHEPELVVPTIGQSLGLRDDTSVPLVQRLHSRLRDCETLLVLDNMEQLVEAGPVLVDLLRACPRVKLLVTSRAVLRLSIEFVYPISGLRVPQGAARHSVDELARVDAVRLFVERARLIDSEFELTPSNAAVVADICAQLDGLPLAIELAAARTRVLSPMALQARLSQRLTLLTGGHRDQPHRHRTIRDAIEWSVQLLSRSDQAVFRRLAAFSGDFTLGAAEVVASGGDVEVFESLGSLVDQSLLERLPAVDGEPRFGMLQTIHDYARELLDSSPERERVEGAHAQHFLNLAESAAVHLTGAEQAMWLNELDLALDDLRSAMQWLSRHGEVEKQIRLATALWRFGYTRGHFSEARSWLRSALDAYGEPTSLRVAALNAEGLLASLQGDTDVAVPRHEEALALSRSIGDAHGEATALNGLGDAAAYQGDHEVAMARYEASLKLFRRHGEQRGVGGALTNLGNLYWDMGELEHAVTIHQEALVNYQAVDDRRGLAWSATNLGMLAVELGDVSAGAGHLKDAIALYRELGDPSGIIVALEGFSEIAESRERRDIEALLLSAAQAMRERIGTPSAVGERERHELVIRDLRRELGDGFDATWNRGASLSVDEAVELALALVDESQVNVPRAIPAVSTAHHGLSRRELEVVRLVAAGKTNNEISDLLCISPRTVTTHISNVFNKLDITNRSALAAFAHREGIV